MRKNIALDPFHWHEALDRAAILSAMFDEWITEHPAVEQTPALRRKAVKISDALGGFYQSVGRMAVDLPMACEAQDARKRRRELLDELFEKPVPHDPNRVKRQRRRTPGPMK